MKSALLTSALGLAVAADSAAPRIELNLAQMYSSAAALSVTAQSGSSTATRLPSGTGAGRGCRNSASRKCWRSASHRRCPVTHAGPCKVPSVLTYGLAARAEYCLLLSNALTVYPSSFTGFFWMTLSSSAPVKCGSKMQNAMSPVAAAGGRVHERSARDATAHTGAAGPAVRLRHENRAPPKSIPRTYR